MFMLCKNHQLSDLTPSLSFCPTMAQSFCEMASLLFSNAIKHLYADVLQIQDPLPVGMLNVKVFREYCNVGHGQNKKKQQQQEKSVSFLIFHNDVTYTIIFYT